VTNYGPASYGDAFAEVYDEWYGPSSSVASSDLDTTVCTLLELADGGRVLELGVGTGRIALPLAKAGADVHGIDASLKMLDQLAAKPGNELLNITCGDMATDLPPGPFSLIFVAINTFFNLTTVADQRTCLRSVAERLGPDGLFVIEAFVPDLQRSGADLTLRTVSGDGVTLMASVTDPVAQTVVGQLIELKDGTLPRLKPWQIRYATPDQLDELAQECGLRLWARWANWDRETFKNTSSHHVSAYRSQSFGVT
jgi:SAM-dependent methyltransferase